ncbi:MAG: hypothetical protein HMLIMOIP_000760 [Candidatus Nitrosomirales archaeon]
MGNGFSSSRRIYKIHPSIGIARVGNADADQFFIGPETPGLPATGELPGTRVPPYKDNAGKIKPQAARFRIWEYKLIKGKYTPTREITLKDSDIEKITWTVHLANRKASFYKFDGEAGEYRSPAVLRNLGKNKEHLEIDPGPRTISGKNKKRVEFKKGTSTNPRKERWPKPPAIWPKEINYLGEIRTDDKGRLIVIGGKGISATNVPGTPIIDDINNDNWFDDVSDGPVTAQIKVKRGKNGKKKKIFEAVGAWVIVAPPDFAPPIGNTVTLYDVLYDLAARELTIPKDNALYDTELRSLKDINREFKGRKLLRDYEPSFNDEIFPILKHAADVVWVYEPAKQSHGSIGADPKMWQHLADHDKKGLRNAVMSRVRPPYGSKISSEEQNMPELFGDEPYKPGHPRHRLALTHTQYALLEQWRKGRFVGADTTPPISKNSVTPAGLDQAALENCVGGAFCPGIEVGWQIHHKELYLEPFRINHNARSTYRGEKGKIKAGHFTRQMALPWQADFRDCKAKSLSDPSDPSRPVEFGWWPGQRPDHVYKRASDVSIKKMVPWHRPSTSWPIGGSSDKSIPSYEEMVMNFYKLGFVVKKGSAYLESERASDVP